MNAPFKPAIEPATTFVRRHIGPSLPRDVSAMLDTVGAKSLDALMAETLASPSACDRNLSGCGQARAVR
jgi:glycine dehydrogenase